MQNWLCKNFLLRKKEAIIFLLRLIHRQSVLSSVILLIRMIPSVNIGLMSRMQHPLPQITLRFKNTIHMSQNHKIVLLENTPHRWKVKLLGLWNILKKKRRYRQQYRKLKVQNDNHLKIYYYYYDYLERRIKLNRNLNRISKLPIIIQNLLHIYASLSQLRRLNHSNSHCSNNHRQLPRWSHIKNIQIILLSFLEALRFTTITALLHKTYLTRNRCNSSHNIRRDSNKITCSMSLISSIKRRILRRSKTSVIS